ncbi:MAG: 54S ribosomal protein L17 mitochondrial [Sclerophora amabilis]|nr:MAG: 54S ribosomal protein L17 mitochondrial [Sclerophora amabilis]
MNAGTSSVAQLALFLRRSSRSRHVCTACRRTVSQRQYASSATAETVELLASPGDRVPPVTQASSPRPSFQVNAGVLLSRPPQITRELTAFEKAFFFYQRRLNDRLALPFTRYFYFKKDTPADTEWKRKQKSRMTPSRDIGVYNAYSKEGWNDELLVGAKESETDHQLEALLKDAEVPGIGSEEMGEAKRESIERPPSRITEADRIGDERSLARKLERTLYLVVKKDEKRYRFPTAPTEGKESLHQAAERIIVQSGGLNMNTWVVGNAPVGHFSFNHSKPRLIQERGVEELGEKTFFMKARIMAGQPNLHENKLGYIDFKWLCKDELEKAVSPRYWSAIKNMLAER